ncbi:DUF2059 domain-containing protein [Maridesulfovibrio sp. FT414]|uniref:DUF2059 domain-containing protein n=1 Tax=Maridesulfovibrio sp. FT414 TaxID=2979469 RepID=UPI003D8062D5
MMNYLKKSLINILILLTLTSQAAMAEDKNKTEMDLAMELVSLSIDIDVVFSTFEYVATLSAEASIKNDPKLAEYREPFIKAFKESMKETFYAQKNLEKLQYMFAEVYAEEFTCKERQEMITFYKTDTGRKFLKKQPIIARRTEEKATRIFKEMFASDFNEILDAKVKNLQGKGILPKDE